MNDFIQQLMDYLKDIEGRINRLDRQSAAFSEKLKDTDISADQLREIASSFTDEVNEVDENVRTNLKEALALIDELDLQQPEPEVIRPNDLANQFRSVLDSARSEAQKTAAESAAIIKSMDVELKGLVVVQAQEAGLVLPAPRQHIDPGQLSTIRMSFASIPIIPKEVKQPADPR